MKHVLFKPAWCKPHQVLFQVLLQLCMQCLLLQDKPFPTPKYKIGVIECKHKPCFVFLKNPTSFLPPAIKNKLPAKMSYVRITF